MFILTIEVSGGVGIAGDFDQLRGVVVGGAGNDPVGGFVGVRQLCWSADRGGDLCRAIVFNPVFV